MASPLPRREWDSFTEVRRVFVWNCFYKKGSESHTEIGALICLEFHILILSHSLCSWSLWQMKRQVPYQSGEFWEKQSVTLSVVWYYP